MSETETILLQCGGDESETIEVRKDIACELSGLIQDTVGEDSGEEQVVMVTVAFRALQKIVDFFNHYSEHPYEPFPTPFGVLAFEDVVTDEWYRSFLPEDKDELFELLTAANYMNIKSLLDLCCLKVTFLLAHKDPEEIRQILNLPGLSEEEMANCREEHGWLFSGEGTENEA